MGTRFSPVCKAVVSCALVGAFVPHGGVGGAVPNRSIARSVSKNFVKFFSSRAIDPASSSVPVCLLRRAILRKGWAVAQDERLDGVGDVDPVDAALAALDAQLVGLQEDVGVGGAVRRLEAVGGELDQQPERVGEVDRVHEAAVLDAAVADAALVEALDSLGE